MKRVLAVTLGAALGVAIMLGILQPWKRTPRAPVPAPAPPVPMDRFDSARDLIEKDRIEEARALLEDELRADAWSARAVALLALADLRGANPLAAQSRLAQASAINPDLFEIPFVQGHIDMVRKEFRAANRSYTEAIRRRPRDARARGGRAAARFELKEYAGAVEDATAALASESSDADSLFTRAAAYGALNRFEESVRDWTTYLAKRPKDAHAWTNRGNANERMGQKAAAIADWRQAMTVDPTLTQQLEPLINGSQ